MNRSWVNTWPKARAIGSAGGPAGTAWLGNWHTRRARTGGGGTMAEVLDRLDLAVLRMLVEQPRAGVREYARQLGIARGTVQARLDRLQRTGVLASYRPHIAPAAMG